MVPSGFFISMARGNLQVEHLLRRAAFGPNAQDLLRFGDASTSIVSSYLIDYDRVADDVDSKVGQPGYVGTTSPGRAFSPNTSIEDARQRWLFRMVHSQRPLQEKMTLFWHNHFATAYSKVAGVFGGVQATKMMALKSGELPGPQGQIELFREHALGNFRNLLVEVAKDPAMVVWLDGRTNIRARPQENFGREVMELFTFGVGNYTEQDVYAAARVFTGWNLRTCHARRDHDPTTYYEFFYNPNQHDLTAKTFTFPSTVTESDDSGASRRRRHAGRVRPSLGARASSRNRSASCAEVVELLRQRVRSAGSVVRQTVANEYLSNETEMKPVISVHPAVSLVSRTRPSWYARYSWPVEFVVRAIREVGWNGFSIDTARDAAGQHGAEPVRAPGRERVGAGAWMVFDRRHAGPHEFLFHVGRQSAIQSRPRGGVVSQRSRRCAGFLSRPAVTAPFEREPSAELLDVPERRRNLDRVRRAAQRKERRTREAHRWIVRVSVHLRHR